MTDRIPVSKRWSNFQCLTRQAICLSPVSHHTLPPVATSEQNCWHRIHKAYWFTGSLPTYADFFCDVRIILTISGHSGTQEPEIKEHLQYSKYPRADLSSGVLTWRPLAENVYFNRNVWFLRLPNFKFSRPIKEKWHLGAFAKLPEVTAGLVASV